MIAAELKRFTSPTQVRDTYGQTREAPSPLSSVCEEVLRSKAREELERLFAQNNAFSDEVSTLVKAWMTEHSKAILERAVLGLIQDGAQRLINDMRFR